MFTSLSHLTVESQQSVLDIIQKPGGADDKLESCYEPLLREISRAETVQRAEVATVEKGAGEKSHERADSIALPGHKGGKADKP